MRKICEAATPKTRAEGHLSSSSSSKAKSSAAASRNDGSPMCGSARRLALTLMNVPDLAVTLEPTTSPCAPHALHSLLPLPSHTLHSHIKSYRSNSN